MPDSTPWFSMLVTSAAAYDDDAISNKLRRVCESWRTQVPIYVSPSPAQDKPGFWFKLAHGFKLTNLRLPHRQPHLRRERTTCQVTTYLDSDYAVSGGLPNAMLAWGAWNTLIVILVNEGFDVDSQHISFAEMLRGLTTAYPEDPLTDDVLRRFADTFRNRGWYRSAIESLPALTEDGSLAVRRRFIRFGTRS